MRIVALVRCCLISYRAILWLLFCAVLPKDFKVGQEVAILRSVKSRPEVLVSAVITKVGRKYVWARMSDNRMDVRFEKGADQGYE